MICESCHGQGVKHANSATATTWLAPCEECGGTGYDHCCDPKAYPDMACPFRADEAERSPTDASR